LSTNRAGQPRPGRPGGARPQRARRPRPLPPGSTLFSPGASPAREQVERRSATLLLWLHQLPAWLPAVLAAALLVVGMAARGVGAAAALCGLAVLLAWLGAISWPRLSGQGRALRVGAVAVALGLAAFRLLHG